MSIETLNTKPQLPVAHNHALETDEITLATSHTSNDSLLGSVKQRLDRYLQALKIDRGERETICTEVIGRLQLNDIDTRAPIPLSTLLGEVQQLINDPSGVAGEPSAGVDGLTPALQWRLRMRLTTASDPTYRANTNVTPDLETMLSLPAIRRESMPTANLEIKSFWRMAVAPIDKLIAMLVTTVQAFRRLLVEV